MRAELGMLAAGMTAGVIGGAAAAAHPAPPGSTTERNLGVAWMLGGTAGLLTGIVGSELHPTKLGPKLIGAGALGLLIGPVFGAMAVGVAAANKD